jgi:HNH endonuclease
VYSKQAYITPIELQKIIIPLAGDKASMEDYIKALMDFRNGNLDISKFPDCSPGANDKRMVREFLLFLSHYGFCQLAKGASNAADMFFIQPEYISEIQEIANISSNDASIETIIQEIRDNQIILNTERQKVLTRVIARPQQAQFRKQILTKFDNTCILTGENMSIVLEACHIIPVEHRGSDTFRNGLCLRTDIHTLFDSKHIRFQPNGIVEYSQAMQQSVSYNMLPKTVKMPNFVSKEALSWRYDYY